MIALTILAAPLMAILFGAFIVCAETCLHFEEIAGRLWRDMPWHDWLVGGFLVCGGLAARRNWPRGRPYQAAGWGAMTSLLIAAVDGHLEDWATDQRFVMTLVGLAGLSAGALASTLYRRTP